MRAVSAVAFKPGAVWSLCEERIVGYTQIKRPWGVRRTEKVTAATESETLLSEQSAACLQRGKRRKSTFQDKKLQIHCWKELTIALKYWKLIYLYVFDIYKRIYWEINYQQKTSRTFTKQEVEKHFAALICI